MYSPIQLWKVKLFSPLPLPFSEVVDSWCGIPGAGPLKASTIYFSVLHLRMPGKPIYEALKLFLIGDKIVVLSAP